MTDFKSLGFSEYLVKLRSFLEGSSRKVLSFALLILIRPILSSSLWEAYPVMHCPWLSTCSTWALNQKCIGYVDGTSSLILVKAGCRKWFSRMSRKTWVSAGNHPYSDCLVSGKDGSYDICVVRKRLLLLIVVDFEQRICCFLDIGLINEKPLQ